MKCNEIDEREGRRVEEEVRGNASLHLRRVKSLTVDARIICIE